MDPLAFLVEVIEQIEEAVARILRMVRQIDEVLSVAFVNRADAGDHFVRNLELVDGLRQAADDDHAMLVRPVEKRFELLRFERLCRYLRAREPDAQIGYAMFVFRLSEAEIDAAVNSSFSDWQRAISAATSRAQPR